MVHDLRAALFAHVQRLPAAFFDRNPVGRVMTRILGDVEAIGEVFTAGVVAIVGDVVTLAGVVAVMLLLHFRLTLVTFTVLPLLVALGLLLREPVRRAYREVRARLAHLNADLQETISGMTVIQLFGREAARAGELGALNDRYRLAQYRRVTFDATFYAVTEAIGAIVVAGLLWWGGIEILDGTLTFGVLVAFMQYTHRFYLPIRDASAKFSVMQSATVAAERVFALLDTPAEAGGRAAPARRGRPGPGARRPEQRPPAIELRDVWFAYPGPGERAEKSRPAGRGDKPRGRSAASRSASRPASGSRSSAPPGRGRRRSRGSSPGPTTSSAAPCWWRASTCGSGTWSRSGATSAWCSRTWCSSPAPSPTT